MRIRFQHLPAMLTLALLSCDANISPVKSQYDHTVPSKELYQALQLFIKADTLNHHPKFYAAFIKQDSIAGNLAIYVFDAYNSNGDVKALPITTWEVDQKPIFVFSGLEAVATGGDTTHYHIIRETEAANKGKIWSPDLRCWRISVKDQRIVQIDKQVFFYPFGPSALPPPFPKISYKSH